MDTSIQPDPNVYVGLRTRALQLRLPAMPSKAVHAVLMDWKINQFTVTVLAAADGTASVYISNGGGFLGGGEKSPKIRQAAIRSVGIANTVLSNFRPTEAFDLPPEGKILFYATCNEGVFLASANEADIKSGKDPLAALGNAMQDIISQYRLMA